ncbi:MAG: DUF92 domain-containing protein [Gemmatimonadaceae bacterium]
MTETIFTHSWLLFLPGRAVAGTALALVIAGLAWRAGSLRRSGSVAAVLCGALCAIGGWGWALLLVVYFTAASTLSRAGAREKQLRSERIVTKGGARDIAQVLANGGIYSVAAALTAVIWSPCLAWGAVGALAAASADTWATEIGIWLGGTPRSIISGTYVRTGESGGVTVVGMLGSVAGAAWVGAAAVALGFPRGLGLASVIAGMGGAITDSILGATIQDRRWCDACAEPTERAVHLCGCATRRVGGIQWIDNDVVNLLSTLAGFALGVIVYGVSRTFLSWGAID